MHSPTQSGENGSEVSPGHLGHLRGHPCTPRTTLCSPRLGPTIKKCFVNQLNSRIVHLFSRTGTRVTTRRSRSLLMVPDEQNRFSVSPCTASGKRSEISNNLRMPVPTLKSI